MTPPKGQTCAARPFVEAPHDVRPIVEAPDNVAALFTRWHIEGFPWQLEHELTQALQPYRGVRLLTPLCVVWISKVSDSRDDEVCVMPRSWPLRWRGEQSS
jgi:hypothetical protein